MKEAGHLVRMAVLFLAGICVFLIARQLLVPAGFGKYGHFRAGALDDVRARPLHYAGREACGMCHPDQLKVLTSGKHAGVGCEACHSAQAGHANADDPSSRQPILPDTKVLCRRCHEKNSAKPAGFPQVVVAAHAGEEPCKNCHVPHNPSLR
jgi:hypothetical protein